MNFIKVNGQSVTIPDRYDCYYTDFPEVQAAIQAARELTGKQEVVCQLSNGTVFTVG